MALKSNQEMAILLLEFEKAYDGVDWSFLEGTMLKFGFDNAWIRVVAALYSGATSRVLLGGSVGTTFQLTRSVHQGCPLAPFLFLFFVEAMSIHLKVTGSGIWGISLPIPDQEVLEVELADDTRLFLKGTLANLQKVELAINTFCLVLGAKINWSKLMGFLVGEKDPLVWSSDEHFRWVPRSLVRYLRCQVGIELAPEQQIDALLFYHQEKIT